MEWGRDCEERREGKLLLGCNMCEKKNLLKKGIRILWYIRKSLSMALP